MSESLVNQYIKKYPKLKKFLQYDKSHNWLSFLDHLFKKIDEHISKNWKVLIITLTKKSAEEITNFFLQKGYKAYYLHSEISTLERWEIIKKLRTWKIDILVWINLLREGIDLPEVSLIAILDADNEWFLRSKTALIQIIWRAARNPNWEVILYANKFTQAIIEWLHETYRRRDLQEQYNQEHWIEPTIAIWNAKNLESVKDEWNLKQDFNLISQKKNNKKLKRMTKKEKEIILKDLKKQLDECIKKRDFETAAIVRDQIKELTWD